MEKTGAIKFEHISFGKKLKSMLSVDFRRMFTTPLFYIMVGIALVIPILVLVAVSIITIVPEASLIDFFSLIIIASFSAKLVVFPFPFINELALGVKPL